MSDTAIKYAKDHLPSFFAVLVAILSAATVLAQKSHDLESLQQGAIKMETAIERLESKDADEMMLLQELKTNQEWIIATLKKGAH